MLNTWFTSDHHFGHKNILVYEKKARPFTTLQEMHGVMIERWNSMVGKNDIIYHLGDFCFGKHNLSIAAMLNGQKKLIMGNHDVYPTSSYLEYFDKVYGCLFWRNCVLRHMPVHPNGLGRRWKLNLHGHLHSSLIRYPVIAPDQDGRLTYHVTPNYMNVSVEQNNLTPIHADVIRDRLKELG
jgi:calcineurin-like phosphoesterase family protein